MGKPLPPDKLYPGFQIPADHILKFIAANTLFTLMLKDDSIIHHHADDKAAFREWLISNNVTDIKKTPSGGEK